MNRIRTLPGILCFLLATGLLFCALHCAVDTGMRRIRAGMFGAFNRVAEGKVNADIIVTGSSRAVLQYDPAILSKEAGLSVFNIGRIGALTNAHTGVLRLYLHHNRPPRLIIENLDLYSLGNNGELYDIPQYTPYLDDPGLYEALRTRYPAIWKARCLPLYGYVANDVEFSHYLGLKALFNIQPQEDYENGYRPITAEWTQAFARLTARQKEFRYDGDAQGERDFEDFLSEGESRGIPTILVLSPVYYEHLAMVVGRPELMARFAELGRRHGAAFWDLSDLAPISGNKRYFFDSIHMNRSGATAFSEVLGHRIAAWLADGHP